MAFKIIVSPRTQNEIIDSIDFYAIRSKDAPINFIIQIQKVYQILETNPFFKICYKNVRAVPERYLNIHYILRLMKNKK